MKEKPKIGIIGIGMVGRPVMRWFSERGWERNENLFCYDTDPKKNFFDDVSKADIVFICVPTPPNADGSCNISIVESAIKNLRDTPERAIVIKSTVPPGTTSFLNKKYKNKGHFLFNPEFLTEAQAWEDFIKPDRQIIAAAGDEARKWLSAVLSLLPTASFQSPGVEGTYKFHEARSTEAELAKYGGNVFGAIKVTLGNILADFCELLGADYENVRYLLGHDRRIGHAWLDVYHGGYRGFGGYCFPKDLDALIAHGEYLLANLKNKKDNKIFEKALKVLKSVRDYNETLLNSQGYTAKKISLHDKEVEKVVQDKK